MSLACGRRAHAAARAIREVDDNAAAVADAAVTTRRWCWCSFVGVSVALVFGRHIHSPVGWARVRAHAFVLCVPSVPSVNVLLVRKLTNR